MSQRANIRNVNSYVSKIILNPKRDNRGFLKPEYLFNFIEYPCSLLYLLTVYLEPINQIVTSPKEI